MIPDGPSLEQTLLKIAKATPTFICWLFLLSLDRREHEYLGHGPNGLEELGGNKR